MQKRPNYAQRCVVGQAVVIEDGAPLAKRLRKREQVQPTKPTQQEDAAADAHEAARVQPPSAVGDIELPDKDVATLPPAPKAEVRRQNAQPR